MSFIKTGTGILEKYWVKNYPFPLIRAYKTACTMHRPCHLLN